MVLRLFMKEFYTKLQSQTIGFLRFPLMLMVVFIHAPHTKGDMQSVNYYNMSGEDIYTIVVALAHTLTNVAVPAFFMFSGFLFFYNTKSFTKEIYFGKLQKRISSLLIPYLIWNIVPLILSLVLSLKNGTFDQFWSSLSEKGGVATIFWNYSTWTNKVTNQVYFGPALLPLWFLRDLILTVILSPIIFFIVKRLKILGVVILGLLYYFKVGGVVAQYNLNQLITATFFFSLGSYFSLNDLNMVSVSRSLNKFVILPFLLMAWASVYYYQTDVYKYVLPFYVIFGIIVLINITSVLLQRGIVKEISLLSKSSFFIYLAHVVLIMDVSRIIVDRIFTSENMGMSALNFILTPLLCTLICISLYWVMNKIMPKVTAVITGGR